jgi:mannosyltransferase
MSGLVVTAAVALWLCTSRRLVGGDRELFAFAIAWFAIPTGIILLSSALADPIYTPRYLCFTAPAIALILGLCIGTLARSAWVTAAVVVLFAIAAAPNHLAVQRGPYAKYGMDYSQVADLITAKAAPGDCLLVNDTVTFHPAPMRPLMAARPDAYRKLVDLSLWQRATDHNAIFDTNLIPQASMGPMEHCGVLWIITQADDAAPGHEEGLALLPGPRFGNSFAFAVTHDLGFRLVERWQFNLVQVFKAVR